MFDDLASLVIVKLTGVNGQVVELGVVDIRSIEVSQICSPGPVQFRYILGGLFL